MAKLEWMGALWLVMLAVACQDETLSSVKEAKDTCDKLRVVSDAAGCGSPGECDVEPACRAAADALIECIARDVSQCLCEEDGDELNCEGATKPSEGPAKCRSEGQALAACQRDG